MIALLLGTVLTLAALALVLQPLFAESAAPRPGAQPSASTRTSEAERALAALREVEFDRATGKLSSDDYAELKAAYTREAVAAMRSEEVAGAPPSGHGGAAPTDDDLEAVIRRYRGASRVCASCGPRPEPSAVYCSECGGFLTGVCPGCAAPVPERGARFCSGCGYALGSTAGTPFAAAR